jgi:4-methylaminobutanoate oxidase (formaldehyde-forming)
MACFTVPADIILQGRETIYRNGERAGWLTSGGYGYTIEKSIGYGYVRHAEGVDAAYVNSGEYELEVATRRVKCDVYLSPLYDPKMERVKS